MDTKTLGFCAGKSEESSCWVKTIIPGTFFNDLIFVALKDELLCINAEKGTITKVIAEIPEKLLSSKKSLPPPSFFQFHSGKKVLSALWTWAYAEIDLDRLEVSVFRDMRTELRRAHIRFKSLHYPAICGDHLITPLRYTPPAPLQDYEFSELAAFNTRTFAIDWRFAFPREEEVWLGSNKPVVEGNRIYMLDVNGVLHIFERTT